MKKSPIIKLIAFSLVGIVILWIIQAVITGAGYGYGMNYGMNYGHHYGGRINMYNGMYFGDSITYLLMIAIKILFALFVIGLLAGLVVWVKNSLFTVEEREAIKNTFTGKQVKKEVCNTCGKELGSEWKVCPYCGKEKETAANNA